MSDDQQPIRPIDDAFWAEWVACEQECFRYALRFTRNKQAAFDLRDQALDATVRDPDEEGARPPHVGTPVEHHVKGVIRSMHSHELASMSGLVLRRKKTDKDPDPAAETRSPLEEAADNERTRVLQTIAQVLQAKAKPGSLEEGYLRLRAQGVEDLEEIADKLGVTYRQVVDVQKAVRRKFNELLRERGYDGEES